MASISAIRAASVGRPNASDGNHEVVDMPLEALMLRFVGPRKFGFPGCQARTEGRDIAPTHTARSGTTSHSRPHASGGHVHRPA